MTSVTGSQRAKRQADELLQRAEALANELKIETLHAEILAARAVTAYMLGRLEEILEPSYAAERIFRSSPGTGRDADGEYYHRLVVVSVRIGALFMLGDLTRGLSELAQLREDRHVMERRSEDLEHVVQWELNAARRIPMDDGRILVPLRTRARLDYIAGKRDAAIANLTRLIECAEAIGSRAETLRDKYALALMVGAEGAASANRCEQQLRDTGYVDPFRELLTAYPELGAR